MKPFPNQSLQKNWLNVLGLILTMLCLCAFRPMNTGRSAPPTDPDELDAFFDGIMLSNMQQRHIPGAAVVVVQSGEIIFSKGYGYADVGRQIPVDPQSTMFRIGSVSKLFTWTAVMQLVEEGRLDLDADVNAYLDFEIPETYPQPVTMRHLMSHTAGFEDLAYAILAESPETLEDNGTWLATHIPARVRPPGMMITYSNYGSALAGYIVERITETPYDDYIDAYILQPLDMQRSTSRQPLPAHLEKNMALGYRFEEGAFEPQKFELYNIAPAGAFSAAPNDLAHFMIAHLQNGRYRNASILQPATTQQMHSRLFSNDERINGMAYGFFEIERDGLEITGHDGDTLQFHSQLSLLPQDETGIFTVCSSEECLGFPQLVIRAFQDHFYPPEEVKNSAAPDDTQQRAGLISGQYRPTSTSYTTFESLINLTTVIDVTILENGELLMFGRRFVETDPMIFRQVDGDYKLLCQQDETGHVSHIFLSGQPFVYERVGGLDSPLFQFTLLGLCLLLFLSAVIGLPLLLWLRRRYSRAPQPRPARLAHLGLIAASLICIIFMASVATTLLDESPLYEGFQGIVLWRILLVVIVLLGALASIMVAAAWKHRFWTLCGRIHSTLVVLAIWALVWFAGYWHIFIR